MSGQESGSASSAGPTAEQQLVVTRAYGLVTQLFLLDDFWTREAGVVSQGAADRAERVSSLGRVVEEMDGLLQQFDGIADEVASIFREHAEAMQATVDAIVEGRAPEGLGRRLRLTEEERSMLRDIVNDGGGNIGMIAAEAAESARNRSASERQTLRTELDRLANNEASGGDFTSEQERDLAWVAAGASVFFGPEAGVVVEAVAHLAEFAVSIFHDIFG